MGKKKTRRDYNNKNNLRSESGVRPKKKNKKKYIENLKEKFRKSQEWKDFRSHMAVVFNHRDYITGRRLIKGYNVHHLKTDQDAENYCDISHEDEFIPLNSYCHKMLHYLFIYYKKDKSIMGRLTQILDRMCELSQGDMREDLEKYDEPVESEESQLANSTGSVLMDVPIFEPKEVNASDHIDVDQDACSADPLDEPQSLVV